MIEVKPLKLKRFATTATNQPNPQNTNSTRNPKQGQRPTTMSTREIVHVSLGSPACHVSAHYLNLLGLSVTSSDNDNDQGCDNEGSGSGCDPSITHTTTKQQVLVPRALLIDEPYVGSSSSGHTQSDTNNANSVDVSLQFAAFSPLSLEETRVANPSALWSNGIERVDILQRGDNENNNTRRLHDPTPRQDILNFRQTASQLSYGAHSRYRSASPFLQSGASTTGYSISSNDRTVNWDDLPDDDEEEESEEDRRRRERQDRSNWKRQIYPQAQEKMDSFWGNMLGSVSQEGNYPSPSTSADTSLGNNNTMGGGTNNDKLPDEKMSHFLSWRDFWMPPCHSSSILDLPISRSDFDSSNSGEHWPSWDYYYPVRNNRSAPEILREWTQDQFLDGQVRRLLEGCDSCQGVVITSSGNGVYAGLATQLLHYLQDDCPGARRWIWSLEESLALSKLTAGAATAEIETDKDSASWRTQRIQRTRQQMQVGLKWQDYLEAAHSVLTLQVPTYDFNGEKDSLFHSTAIMAAALETATLPYRLSTSGKARPQSRVGLNSYYYGSFSGDSPFGSAPRLNLSEFLTNLQPAPGLSVLELDTLIPKHQNNLDNPRSLASFILEGTSLERDRRMREKLDLSGGRRPRDVLPGSWMLDESSSKDGLLSSLSPQRNNVDRSLHTHFALAGALRYENHKPWNTESSPSSSSSSDKYVDCLMQGMGIRYRPEQSLAVHLGEGLSTLTGNSGYGAGSYWKHVWRSQEQDGPVLSVLGNTTRFFAQASEMGAGAKEVLSPMGVTKGFFNRDVSNGIFPEADDCHEVLSALYNIRDKYRPPSGSGLMDDEDGAYYD